MAVVPGGAGGKRGWRRWEAAAVFKTGKPLGFGTLGDFYVLATDQDTSICKNQ